MHHSCRSSPGSVHVREIGLAGAPDTALWDLAADRGLALDTRDADFVALSTVRAAPPKVIWLDIGNAATAATAKILQANLHGIDPFMVDPEAAFRALGFASPLR